MSETNQPDPAGETGARGVRCQIDELVRTAAPRLGKVAVARIAGPLTEAIIALRDELHAEAEARAAEPIAIGDLIFTPRRLEHAPVGTVLRDADGVLFERFRGPAGQPGRWYSTGVANAVDVTLPARVLDLEASS